MKLLWYFSYCLQKLDQLSTPIDTLDLKNCRLDNRSCEALEAVLSRMHMTTIDLERTGLEDDVSDNNGQSIHF